MFNTGELHAGLKKDSVWLRMSRWFAKVLSLKVRCEQYGTDDCIKERCKHGVWHVPIRMIAFNRTDREFTCQDWDVCYRIGKIGSHSYCCKNKHKENLVNCDCDFTREGGKRRCIR